ncbi:hypothetical protein HNQ56_001017 [Anaerotaenia torta]
MKMLTAPNYLYKEIRVLDEIPMRYPVYKEGP